MLGARRLPAARLSAAAADAAPSAAPEAAAPAPGAASSTADDAPTGRGKREKEGVKEVKDAVVSKWLGHEKEPGHHHCGTAAAE